MKTAIVNLRKYKVTPEELNCLLKEITQREFALDFIFLYDVLQEHHIEYLKISVLQVLNIVKQNIDSAYSRQKIKEYC